MRVNQERK